MKTGVSVHDAMTKKPITVSLNTSLKKCAELMETNQISSVLIEGNNKLVGIITEQDLVRKVIAKGVPHSSRVKDFMSKNLKTVESNVDIFDALNKMKDENAKTLPVMEGKKVVGMLALKDVLKIQPSLFEIWVEKMNIKDAKNKPIFSANPKEGICEACGEYFPELNDIGGSLLCDICKKEQK